MWSLSGWVGVLEMFKIKDWGRSYIGVLRSIQTLKSILNYLHAKGIIFSNQALNTNGLSSEGQIGSLLGTWKLEFHHQEEWNNYIEMLRISGIYLNDIEDALVWS